MPTVITHAAVPLCLGLGLGSRVIPPRLLFTGLVLAMLPDADVLAFKFGVAYGNAFGHRGFTHSLLAVFGLLTLFYLKVPESWIVPADAIQGMVLGYLSHILADMLTPAGVPLLWPCRWRFRLPILVPQKGNQLERVLCMALFAYAVWMPQTLPENGAVRWSSQMINSLQFQFNRFINHQIEH